MTQDQHQQRIVDLIRQHAKEMWEKHCKVRTHCNKLTGEWNLAQVVAGNIVDMKKKNIDEDSLCYVCDLSCSDITTITHDTGKLSFPTEMIFHILRKMESLCRIPKSKRIIFGRDQNGNYCHYQPLCEASQDEHYVTPCPPATKLQTFKTDISKEAMQRIMKGAMDYKRKQLLKQFQSRHFFFLFNLQQSA